MEREMYVVLIYVCVFAHICEGSHAHGCMFVSKPKVYVGCCSLRTICLVLCETGSRTVTWGLPVQLDCLARWPQELISLGLPSAGLTVVHHLELYTWVLGIKLGSSCLHLTQWTTSSVPTVLFLEIVKARKRQKYADGTQIHCGQEWGKRKRGEGALVQTQMSWPWIDFDCCFPSNDSEILAPKRTNLRLRTLQLNRACFRQRTK